jgi:hypothetical protein
MDDKTWLRIDLSSVLDAEVYVRWRRPQSPAPSG